MKPIIFRWTQTSNRSFAYRLDSDADFKKRVEQSLKSLEDYLEELADKQEWEEITRIIPYDQLVKNGILINDAGDKDRMFLFVTLGNRTAESIIEGLYSEHYTHIVYLDLMDSIKC